MGKRSNFERNERDFYPTPFQAVQPLLDVLEDGFKFFEPCAGNGALIDHLETKGRCVGSCDLEPQRNDIEERNALEINQTTLFRNHEYTDFIITNPPWDRKILHPLIDNLRQIKPTFILLDSDWMFTKQSSEYMKYCRMVIAVGRVKWIPDSKMTGKDNCAWYLFDKYETQTIFKGR